MKQSLLFYFLISFQCALGQGGSVIPDDLDCDNLTSAYAAAYGDYCKELAALERKEAAMQESVTSVKNAHDALSRIVSLREDGWEKVLSKDYSEALALFKKALALDEQHKALHESYAMHLQSIVDAVERQVNASQTRKDYGVWEGKVDNAPPAKKAPVVNKKAEPWYAIKYGCYAAEAKGLEILQVVKGSGPDYIEIEVHLRFNDMHPKYFRNVFLTRFVDFSTSKKKRWIALINAGLKNGTEWVAPETLRIPRTWSYEAGQYSYTAVWDDEKQRYRLSNWPNETPYKRELESELFGVIVECDQYDPDPSDWEHVIRL